MVRFRTIFTQSCHIPKQLILYNSDYIFHALKTPIAIRYVEAPDGGWGWVVVAAVWLCNVLVLGMLKSFGVLFPAFRDYFHGSAGAISWINSISLSMRATAGILSLYGLPLAKRIFVRAHIVVIFTPSFSKYLFSMLCLAPVSAALSNRFGERKIVALGGVLTTLGLIISYFATSPYYLYASMGCIAGNC